MADNISFPLCTFCDERNTKYSCVSCNKVACNICTKPAPEHTGYDEENKKVGICQNCLQNIDTMTVSDNNKNLPVSAQGDIDVEVRLSHHLTLSNPEKRNRKH